MIRKICSGLTTILLIVLLAIAGILLVPPLFGWKGFAVQSGSMMPEIKVGEIVFAKKTEATQLKVGDIITYQLGGFTNSNSAFSDSDRSKPAGNKSAGSKSAGSKSALVTHRIVEIDEERQCVITRGDANETADGSPVLFENIVGRVDFHVPCLGYISLYSKTPLGIAVGSGLVMVLIVLNLLSVLLEKRERKDTGMTVV